MLLQGDSQRGLCKTSSASTQLTMFSVHLPDQVFNFLPEHSICHHLSSCRNRQLHKNDFPHPFRMIRHKSVECQKFLWNALDVIEAVNPKKDLLTFKFLLQTSEFCLRCFRLEFLSPFVCFDAEREAMHN